MPIFYFLNSVFYSAEKCLFLFDEINNLELMGLLGFSYEFWQKQKKKIGYFSFLSSLIFFIIFAFCFLKMNYINKA